MTSFGISPCWNPEEPGNKSLNIAYPPPAVCTAPYIAQSRLASGKTPPSRYRTDAQ